MHRGTGEEINHIRAVRLFALRLLHRIARRPSLTRNSLDVHVFHFFLLVPHVRNVLLPRRKSREFIVYNDNPIARAAVRFITRLLFFEKAECLKIYYLVRGSYCYYNIIIIMIIYY